MRKIVLIILFLIIMLFFGACEEDNIEFPIVLTFELVDLNNINKSTVKEYHQESGEWLLLAGNYEKNNSYQEFNLDYYIGWFRNDKGGMKKFKVDQTWTTIYENTEKAKLEIIFKGASFRSSRYIEYFKETLNYEYLYSFCNWSKELLAVNIYVPSEIILKNIGHTNNNDLN